MTKSNCPEVAEVVGVTLDVEVMLVVEAGRSEGRQSSSNCENGKRCCMYGVGEEESGDGDDVVGGGDVEDDDDDDVVGDGDIDDDDAGVTVANHSSFSQRDCANPSSPHHRPMARHLPPCGKVSRCK